jgi:hypothetical protein
MSGFLTDNQFYSPDSFVYQGSIYELDPDTGRFYRFDESRSLRPEMDGAQVKRRISREAFRTAFENCSSVIFDYINQSQNRELAIRLTGWDNVNGKLCKEGSAA